MFRSGGCPFCLSEIKTQETRPFRQRKKGKRRRKKKSPVCFWYGSFLACLLLTFLQCLQGGETGPAPSGLSSWVPNSKHLKQSKQFTWRLQEESPEVCLVSTAFELLVKANSLSFPQPCPAALSGVFLPITLLVCSHLNCKAFPTSPGKPSSACY